MSVSPKLFRIRVAAPTASRQVIQRMNVTSTPTTLLPETYYKKAEIYIHGDGDPSLELQITVGGDIMTLTGSDQAVINAVNENVKIEATSGTGYSPTITIVSMSW